LGGLGKKLGKALQEKLSLSSNMLEGVSSLAIALRRRQRQSYTSFFTKSNIWKRFPTLYTHSHNVAGEFTSWGCYRARFFGSYLRLHFDVPLITCQSTKTLENLDAIAALENVDLYFEAAKKSRLSKPIAFGHHQDDNAEQY